MDTDVPLLTVLQLSGGLAVADVVLLVLALAVSLAASLMAFSASAGRITRSLTRQGLRQALAGSILAGLLGAALAFITLFGYLSTTLGTYAAVWLALALSAGPVALVVSVGLWQGVASANGRAGWAVNAGHLLARAITFWLVRERSSNGDSERGEDEEPDYELTLASGEEVEEEERQYIENILELGETTAHEVMTPRTDVMALDVNWEPGRVIEEVAGARFSRFPVFDENIDDIIGVLHLRDLLEFLARGQDTASLDLRKLLIEPLFVPAGNKIDDVLRELQKRKNHMAVVLDEYGGTAGILTIEDLLEEIVGEIQDEYDDESKLFYQRNDGAYVVTAYMPLDELGELLGQELEAEDVETLGGFVTVNLGHIPQAQESVECEGLRFTVMSVARNRIGRVLVERVEESAA